MVSVARKVVPYRGAHQFCQSVFTAVFVKSYFVTTLLTQIILLYSHS